MAIFLKVFIFLCLITRAKAIAADVEALQDLQDPPIQAFQQFIEKGYLKTGGFTELMAENKDLEKPHYPGHTWEESSEHFVLGYPISENCLAKGEFWWKFDDTDYEGKPGHKLFSMIYLNPALVKNEIDLFKKIKIGEIPENGGWRKFIRYCDEVRRIIDLRRIWFPYLEIPKHFDPTPINQLFWNRLLLMQLAVDSLIKIRKQQGWGIKELDKIKKVVEKLLAIKDANTNILPPEKLKHISLIAKSQTKLLYSLDIPTLFFPYEDMGFEVDYEQILK